MVIVAAGLTPAWQQIVRLDGFRVGEVNRARDVQWCASGKVLNVGIALAHLGYPCETVALVGGAPLAHIEREFASLGIPRRWIESHWATRVCTTILDSQTGRATELVENAGPITESELTEFHAAYCQSIAKAEIVILAGSLPRGTPSVFFRDLLSHTACPAVLDIRGLELLAALEHSPMLIKPNREELALTLGRPIESDVQLHHAMREVNDRGAQWVVVTDGPGPVWASSQNKLYRWQPPSVKVVNPIGSGDCLAAGIAWGLALRKHPLEAIQVGIAAAIENVGQILPARLDPEQVLRRAGTLAAESV